MVTYRPQRGGFEESMALCSPVLNLQQLAKVLMVQLGQGVSAEDVEVRYYAKDNRNGWDTHIVNLAGIGAVGYTNGPLND